MSLSDQIRSRRVAAAEDFKKKFDKAMTTTDQANASKEYTGIRIAEALEGIEELFAKAMDEK